MAARTPLALSKAVVGLAAAVSIGCDAAGGTPASMDKNLTTTIDSALADAEYRTGLARSALRLASAEAVTWSDGSLGCPVPGMTYTQALVPGFRIRIQAGAETLDYHASRRGQLTLCPAGRAIDPVTDDSK